ncbi:hypothetical protein D3C71_1951790 [compost metagenome]
MRLIGHAEQIPQAHDRNDLSSQIDDSLHLMAAERDIRNGEHLDNFMHVFNAHCAGLGAYGKFNILVLLKRGHSHPSSNGF